MTVIGESENFRVYRLPNGRIPIYDWLSTITDTITIKTINARLVRLRKGHFGKYGRIGQDIYELKIYRGPGYRIYFCKLESNIIVVLNGGPKGTQSSDIARAQSYFEDLTGGQT